MGVDPDQLHQGQIVWAVVRDRNGFRKRRPAIILTPETEIHENQPLVLMAVTTSYPDPPPPNHVELPWHHDRRKASTGLARRSAAVTDWLVTAYADEVDETIGKVPPRLIREILERLSDETSRG